MSHPFIKSSLPTLALSTLLAASTVHIAFAQTYPLPSACEVPTWQDPPTWEDLWQFADNSNVGNVPKYQFTEDNKVVLIARSNRNPNGIERHIVGFGDMHGVDNHLPPNVSAAVRDIFQQADLVVGNLESPITEEQQSGPLAKNESTGLFMNGTGQFMNNFHMTRAYLKGFMAQLCVAPRKAVFTVANNHANEAADTSAENRWVATLNSIVDLNTSVGYRFTGVDLKFSNASAPFFVDYDLGGARVGIIGWTHIQNSTPPADYPGWFTDERVMYSPNGKDTDPKTSIRDFNAIKQQRGWKMVIGMPHWDCQPHSYPQLATINQADALLNNGMDLILGSHQSRLNLAATKSINNKNKAVFYGLGQLYTGTSSTPGVPMLSIAVDTVVDGEGNILEYTVHPLVRRRLPAPIDATPVCSSASQPGVATADSEMVTFDEAMVTYSKAKTSAAMLALQALLAPLTLSSAQWDELNRSRKIVDATQTLIERLQKLGFTKYQK